MNKEERKIKAQKHFEYTSDAYSDCTSRTVGNAVVYNEYMFDTHMGNSEIPVIVVDKTTEQAVKDAGNHCTVLNFASFTRPGGGFINGAIAQEEALCHSSNLYECLTPYTNIYNKNYNKYMNNGKYKNWAIWSPDVCFIYNEQSFFEEIVEADVITCAAPNYNSYKRFDNSHKSHTEYIDCLYSRCQYILDIAEAHKTGTLILGAFGCGVFENDPHTVATIFKELLDGAHYNFKKVIFAIPNNNRNNNYIEFKKVFE